LKTKISRGHLRRVLFTILTAFAVACGSSGGDSGPLTFAGQVLVPTTPPPLGIAELSTGGLVGVADATVELIMVDDLGIAIDPVLATATTDLDGNFDIELPEGVSFGPNLIVRVVGGAADGLRAQVVSSTTDVDPGSEYVLRQLTENTNSLADVSQSEVQALLALLEQVEIDGQQGIEAAIDEIDDEAGEAIAPLVEAANDAAGDATQLTGDYHLVEFAYEISSAPSHSFYASIGTLMLTGNSGGNGTFSGLVITDTDSELYANSNGSGGANYFRSSETETFAENISWGFEYPASGKLLLVQPRYEEIEEEQGGDIGVVEKTQLHTFHPIATDVFVGTLLNEESDHPLMNNDTEIDLSSTLRRDFSNSLTFVVRQEALSNDALDGSVFGYLSIGELHENDGVREAYTDFGTLTFSKTSGNAGTIDSTADIISVWRTPLTDSLSADVAWIATGDGPNDPIGEDDGDETNGYTLNATNGAFTVATGDVNMTVSGVIANGGKMLLARAVETQTDLSEHGILVGVKLGTSNPVLDGSRYQVMAIFKRYDKSGSSSIARLHGSTLTVNKGDIALSIQETTREVGNDLGSEVETEDSADLATGTVTFDGTNGKASLNLEDALITGYFSEDGSMGVFRFASSHLGEEEGAAQIGMLVLVKLPSDG